jgi:hypothetical protein
LMLEISRRMTERRVLSPFRSAWLRSSLNLSVRATSVSGQSGAPGPSSALAFLGRFLLLALYARLLVGSTPPYLSEDALLLYFPVEPAQHTVEAFGFAKAYISHKSSPPPGRVLSLVTEIRLCIVSSVMVGVKLDDHPLPTDMLPNTRQCLTRDWRSGI